MDKLTANQQQLLNSFESLFFIFAVLAAAVLVMAYGYYRYRRLKTDILMQMKVFNTDIFLKDRAFFEKYGEKAELGVGDFVRMQQDEHFKEHLWRKEISYYKELVKIVESLRLLRIYRWLAIFLLLGLTGVGIYVAKAFVIS